MYPGLLEYLIQYLEFLNFEYNKTIIRGGALPKYLNSDKRDTFSEIS